MLKLGSLLVKQQIGAEKCLAVLVCNSRSNLTFAFPANISGVVKGVVQAWNLCFRYCKFNLKTGLSRSAGYPFGTLKLFGPRFGLITSSKTSRAGLTSFVHSAVSVFCQTCRVFGAILDGFDCTLALAQAFEACWQTIALGHRERCRRAGYEAVLKTVDPPAHWRSETSTIFCSRQSVAHFDAPDALHLGPDRLGVDFTQA